MGGCRLRRGAVVVNDGLLPEEVAADLLRRWAEPHRRYHGLSHLQDGLAVLAELGAGDLELTAFWCHDAVHRDDSPSDELASAEVARRLLSGHLAPREVDEVCRLVLLTISHRVAPGDERGARVVDADLHGLGLPWEAYSANLEAIRAEMPGVSENQWRGARLAFAERMLARESIFATPLGHRRWEQVARANLEREAKSACQK